jgi:uncharacterized protein YoaH (UPF0181 family)
MRIRPLIFAFMAVLFVAGCKDDEKNEETFSSLTTEQHKANLEASGLEVVNEFNELSNMESLNAVNDFIELMNETNSSESGVMTVAESIAALKNASDSAFVVKETISDAPTMGESFKEEAGIYTYNSQTLSWDKEESDSQITYHYPVNNSTENNATISVTNFSYTTTTNADISNLSEELLESVDVSLKINDTELILCKFSASYDEDGIPTSASESFTLEKFKITASVSRSTSNVTLEQSFEHDGSNILSWHFESNGEFNYDKYVEVSDDEDFNPYSQAVIENINAWVAVDTFKLQGIVDWTGFVNDFSKVDTSSISTDQEAKEKMAELMNDNMSLKLKYNESNEIIAVGEVYAMLDEYDYWTTDFRVKFSDESYMDDSFFSEKNFADLVAKVSDLMTSIENNYASEE